MLLVANYEDDGNVITDFMDSAQEMASDLWRSANDLADDVYCWWYTCNDGQYDTDRKDEFNYNKHDSLTTNYYG